MENVEKMTNVNYLLSVHLLKNLKNQKLISEEEFIAIDNENRKSFRTVGTKRLA
jgi:hypothetical protein